MKFRPSGLKYVKHKENPTSFKKGNVPWNKGTEGACKPNSTSFKKGERRSPETEFKYVNGSGYRHLLGDKLERECEKCGETNIKRLHVHHKDKDRTNNNINNLQVLCRPCHLPEHGRRELVYVEGRKAV